MSPPAGSTPSTDQPAHGRAEWRSVAVPTEHGGWGLTLEPVLLGLFVAPSASGALLGLAAFMAFVARTPLKVVLVDGRRGRNLDRTALARRVLAIEMVALVTLAGLATQFGDGRFWLPVLAAAPLVGVELWFDMRSRSRRLVPELAGAVGVSSVVAIIVLADGATIVLALALWLILAARATTSIPFVRSQVAVLHNRPTSIGSGIVSDVAAIAIAAAAVLVDQSVFLGALGIGAIVISQNASRRFVPGSAVVLGVRQTVLGLTLVLITGLGVLTP
jgi:hypothetical protein